MWVWWEVHLLSSLVSVLASEDLNKHCFEMLKCMGSL